MFEKKIRTLARMATYRVCCITTTLIGTYIHTGHFIKSIIFALILNTCFTIIYYFHERFWLEKVKWGLNFDKSP